MSIITLSHTQKKSWDAVEVKMKLDVVLAEVEILVGIYVVEQKLRRITKFRWEWFVMR